ncbi:hypothetical protein C405_20919 [Stenotrophomonas maltophilia AU12-09]|jgi:hypothetical protein|uniref:hypothetical protein n=1 Tax=Stenotrophomonas maltophilia TaxID=40324 RepID=UPI0002BE1C46|nr:hypothetical protein [Stenotrophomonas maltophilia]EMI47512.1 hypothetical protein C405_20919 [Stenotrophomonas maltophilia AU12-09]
MTKTPAFDRVSNLILLIDECLLREVAGQLYVNLCPGAMQWTHVDNAGLDQLMALASQCVARRVEREKRGDLMPGRIRAYRS